MDFTTKLEEIKHRKFSSGPTQSDIEELDSLYNSQIIKLKMSLRENPSDFLRTSEVIKTSTVSLINNILPYSDHFTKKAHTLAEEIERCNEWREVEKLKNIRLCTIDVAEMVSDAVGALFELLLDNFPDVTRNEQVKRIAKDFLPRQKTYLVEDGKASNSNVAGLSHAQHALLLFYNGESPKDDDPTRLVNTFNNFNKPGKAGQSERQCTGRSKRSLTQRLKDFEIIRSLVKATDLQKLDEDHHASRTEYEDL